MNIKNFVKISTIPKTNQLFLKNKLKTYIYMIIMNILSVAYGLL